MKVKVLGEIRGVKPPIGNVQPAIDVDGRSGYTFRLERIDDPRRDIAFATAVDPCDCYKTLR